jgi:CrcB protein
MIKAMLIAGLGGFMGTCGRFLVGKLVTHMGVGNFPLSTLLVNVIGCLLIGILLGLVENTRYISTQLNLLLITGFCGGFTTFSTFSNDLYVLLMSRSKMFFVSYFLASILLGLLMVWCGRRIVLMLQS